MWSRPKRCGQCEHDLVLAEEERRVGTANDFELIVAPHLFLVCPSGHERKLIDGEYPLRCQEWLLDDRLLVTLSNDRGGNGLCRCMDGTNAVTWHHEARRHVVEHRVNGTIREVVVRFRYPVATCDGCGAFRRMVGEDFEACWAAIREP